MFADDTVLNHCHSSKESLLQELQTDLNAVYKWCQRNYITLNISKSQYVQFGYRKPGLYEPRLTIGDTVLEMVQSYKYLGTIIDSKLAEMHNIQR